MVSVGVSRLDVKGVLVTLVKNALVLVQIIDATFEFHGVFRGVH